MGMAWPSTLPMPLLDGYSTAPGAEVARTDMEAGEARVRRRSVSAPDTIKLAWLLDAAQMKIFRAYWDIELAAGAAWCDMNVDVGDGIEQKSVRVIGQYQAAMLSPSRWKVSCEAEVRKLRSSVFDYLNLMGLPSLDLDFAGTQSLSPVITSARQPSPVVSFGRSSVATYVGSDGLLKTAAADEPRFDFDPVTLACKGLLIEEYRVNQLVYSQEFSNSSWLKQNILGFGAGSVANASVAPDGEVTADKIVESTATAEHIVYYPRAASNETVTLSVFAKSGGRSKIQLALSNFLNAALGATFDLAAGTVAGVNSPNADYSAPVARIHSYGNGWYRCSLTVTKAAVNNTNNAAISIANGGGSVVYAGDGVSGIYIWGAQLEGGGFPTSYIPTTSSAQGRLGDTASMVGLNFQQWYRPDEGAFVCESDVSFDSSAADQRWTGAFSANDGTDNNSIHFWASTEYDSVGSMIYKDGISQAGGYFGAVVYGQKVRYAIGYKANDCAAYGNSAASFTDATVAIPVVSRLDLGVLQPGGGILNGHVARLRFFPKRLPNATLQALTV